MSRSVETTADRQAVALAGLYDANFSLEVVRAFEEEDEFRREIECIYGPEPAWMYWPEDQIPDNETLLAILDE